MLVTSSAENRQKMKRRNKTATLSAAATTSPITTTTTTTKSNRRNHAASSKINVQTLNVDLLALMETLIILHRNSQQQQLDPITLLLNPVQRQQYLRETNTDDEPETKKMCLEEDEDATTTTTTTTTIATTANNNEEEYLKLLMRVLADIENAHGQMQFSKEALKFYLATYTNLVRPMDFNNVRNMTNSTVLSRNNGSNSSSKKRPETQLASGAILAEYIRSLDTFLLNLGRATYNDTCALRLMLEHKISLPRRIYTEANLTQPFADITYVEGSPPTTNEDTICLSLGNSSGQFKRCAVLLTRNIILLYDGQQFTMPPALLEREIGTSLLLALPSNNNNKRYIIDMLLSGSGGSGKCRIIDVLEPVMGKSYKERMTMMQELIPNLRHVEQIENKTLAQQENRIYIVNDKYYFCPMPWPIAVAVGLQNRRVLLAFVDNTPLNSNILLEAKKLDDDDDRDEEEEYLRVRLRCSLINNTLLALLSRNRVSTSVAITTTTTSTILGSIKLPDGRRMRIIYEQSRQQQQPQLQHDEDDACVLFDEAIPIELRDTNGVPKIGSIMHTRQLTKSSDYRPQIDNTTTISSSPSSTATATTTTTTTTTAAASGSEMTLSQLTQDMARFVDQFFCLPNYNDIMTLMESRRERFDFKI